MRLLLALALTFFGVWQAVTAEVPGLILARTSPEVVMIWRVNEAIGAALPGHPSRAMLQETLTAQGLAVMLRAMPAGAQPKSKVTLRLVYFADGGYDPNYRIETVSGVRRIGEISCTADAAHRNQKRWQTELAKTGTASGLDAHFEPDAFTGL